MVKLDELSTAIVKFSSNELDILELVLNEC